MTANLKRRSVLGGLLVGAGGLGTACTRTASEQTTPGEQASDRLQTLEESSERLIAAVALRGDRTLVAHRPDEIMPMCSLFKSILVAGLLQKRRQDREYWEEASVEYSRDDLVSHSPVLEARESPISPHDLAEATLRYSDNAAANLLHGENGGPAVLTEFVRDLGAEVTRFDRLEPELNEAAPGDPRDSSSPAELARLMKAILLDREAGAYTAARLATWMLWSETSRVGDVLADGDELASRTGNGSYGVVNETGVLWRPGAEPLVFAIMTRSDDPEAENQDAVVQETARILFEA